MTTSMGDRLYVYAVVGVAGAVVGVVGSVVGVAVVGGIRLLP